MFEAVAIVVNIVAACAIVAVNKEILAPSVFPYAIMLSCLHALFGVVLFFLAWRLTNLFEPVWFSLADTAICGILTVGCVGFFNLTLQHCSVGFYQLAKLAVIPALLLLEMLCLGKTYNRKTLLLVALLLLGIGVATVSDVVCSPRGFAVAAVGVAATAANSVRVHELSKTYKAMPKPGTPTRLP